MSGLPARSQFVCYEADASKRQLWLGSQTIAVSHTWALVL